MTKRIQNSSENLRNIKCRVVVTKNGPYLVFGGLPLAREIIVPDGNGDPVEWGNGGSYPKREGYELCRCGNSKYSPYCSGNHVKIGFDGTETAGRKKYLEQAKRTVGPGLVLT